MGAAMTTDPQPTVPVEPLSLPTPDHAAWAASQHLCSICGHHVHLIPREPCGWYDCPCPILAAARASQPITATAREAIERIDSEESKALAAIRQAVTGEDRVAVYRALDGLSEAIKDAAALPVREDEPTGIDVDAMARALHETAQGDCGDATGDSVTYLGRHRRGDESWARTVVAEYDRLTHEASHVR